MTSLARFLCVLDEQVCAAQGLRSQPDLFALRHIAERLERAPADQFERAGILAREILHTRCFGASGGATALAASAALIRTEHPEFEFDEVQAVLLIESLERGALGASHLAAAFRHTTPEPVPA